jgi:hypothetical protein
MNQDPKTSNVVETPGRESDLRETPQAISTSTVSGVSGTNAGREKRVVKSGMFGLPEIIALALSGLLVAAAIGAFLLLLTPERSALANKKSLRDEQEKKLADAKARLGNLGDTETRVAELADSVERFERNNLYVGGVGRTALYDRVNRLMAGYGLRNTTGPDYSPLPIATAAQLNQNAADKGRDKYRSLFPGVFISMTVEGPYPNLRRFIRDLEASQQFVIISKVELEAAEAKEKREAEELVKQQKTAAAQSGGFDQFGNPINPPPVAASPAPAPKGKTLGEVVSLRLEMTTYFRRESGLGALNAADAAAASGAERGK